MDETLTKNPGNAAFDSPNPRFESRGVLRPLSIAPMMDRTDRHYRSFMRHLTRHTLLYTEMITSGAIIHGDRDYLLGYSDIEHPLSLQIGGSDASEMAECARIAEDWGYDEVNINVGCPSDRVQRGRFGACLMLEPETVATCVSAMRDATPLPVTVKHRIGVDEVDQYEDMARFVRIVRDAGCTHFSVHARKAWLQGLSPKENRNVPPLRYSEIYRLKE
jgi:tRNA-dihydrouridine synthase A